MYQVIAKAIRPHGEPLADTPERLRELLVGASIKPDWFDPELAMAASRGFLRNSDLVMAALVCGAIIEGFSTLISKSFRIRGLVMQNGVRRLKQNMLQLLEQFMPGGILPYGDGWRLSLRTRLVHAQARLLLRQSEVWDFETYGLPLNAAHMSL